MKNNSPDWFTEYINKSREIDVNNIDADNVSWFTISCFCKLSEEFIEKHADKIRWSCLDAQELSVDFF